MQFERTAAERIRYFIKYDPPVANTIRLILRDIAELRTTGKTYDELNTHNVDEQRIKDAFEKVLTDACRFHWRELPGPGFNRRVLVVVICSGSEPLVLNVGYLPRQDSRLV